jgi:glycosyltransferase involved in cell wall biosynthesis
MIKISIITVVKNGLPYIKSAIKSIENQNKLKNNQLEHVIVCSPSTDGTENYLKNNKNIKLIIDNYSTNKFGSINLGLKNCSGDIIGLLHADDVFYNTDTIFKILNSFDKNTDVIYGNVLFSNKKDLSTINRKWISSKFSKKKILLGWMPPHTSIFAKKEVLLKNLYEIKYPISGDYFFILKIFNNINLRFRFINEYITIMRTGGDSTKLKNFFKKLYEDYRILQNFHKFPSITIFFKILTKMHQFKVFNHKIQNSYIEKLNKIIY